MPRKIEDISELTDALDQWPQQGPGDYNERMLQLFRKYSAAVQELTQTRRGRSELRDVVAMVGLHPGLAEALFASNRLANRAVVAALGTGAQQMPTKRINAARAIGLLDELRTVVRQFRSEALSPNTSTAYRRALADAFLIQRLLRRVSGDSEYQMRAILGLAEGAQVAEEFRREPRLLKALVSLENRFGDRSFRLVRVALGQSIALSAFVEAERIAGEALPARVTADGYQAGDVRGLLVTAPNRVMRMLKERTDKTETDELAKELSDGWPQLVEFLTAQPTEGSSGKFDQLTYSARWFASVPGLRSALAAQPNGDAVLDLFAAVLSVELQDQMPDDVDTRSRLRQAEAVVNAAAALHTADQNILTKAEDAELVALFTRASQSARRLIGRFIGSHPNAAPAVRTLMNHPAKRAALLNSPEIRAMGLNVALRMGWAAQEFGTVASGEQVPKLSVDHIAEIATDGLAGAMNADSCREVGHRLADYALSNAQQFEELARIDTGKAILAQIAGWYGLFPESIEAIVAGGGRNGYVVTRALQLGLDRPIKHHANKSSGEFIRQVGDAHLEHDSITGDVRVTDPAAAARMLFVARQKQLVRPAGYAHDIEESAENLAVMLRFASSPVFLQTLLQEPNVAPLLISIGRGKARSALEETSVPVVVRLQRAVEAHRHSKTIASADEVIALIDELSTSSGGQLTLSADAASEIAGWVALYQPLLLRLSGPEAAASKLKILDALSNALVEQCQAAPLEAEMDLLLPVVERRLNIAAVAARSRSAISPRIAAQALLGTGSRPNATETAELIRSRPSLFAAVALILAHPDATDVIFSRPDTGGVGRTMRTASAKALLGTSKRDGELLLAVRAQQPDASLQGWISPETQNIAQQLIDSSERLEVMRRDRYFDAYVADLAISVAARPTLVTALTSGGMEERGTNVLQTLADVHERVTYPNLPAAQQVRATTRERLARFRSETDVVAERVSDRTETTATWARSETGERPSSAPTRGVTADTRRESPPAQRGDTGTPDVPRASTGTGETQPRATAPPPMMQRARTVDSQPGVGVVQRPVRQMTSRVPPPADASSSVRPVSATPAPRESRHGEAVRRPMGSDGASDGVQRRARPEAGIAERSETAASPAPVSPVEPRQDVGRATARPLVDPVMKPGRLANPCGLAHPFNP